MIIAVVTFEIDKELNDTVLKEKFLETSPIYKDTPGLIRKNYICDTSKNLAGGVYCFNNIDNNLTGTFNNINSGISEIWDGGKCALTLADITNDNKLDMILGNVSGGISYFSSDSALVNNFNQEQIKNDILLFPNPANQQVTIINSELNEIKIIDMYGRTLYSQEAQDISTLINIEFLTKGIYLVQSGNRTSKLIIK